MRSQDATTSAISLAISSWQSPNLEGLYQMAQEKLTSGISNALPSIMKQQEEVVVQRLMPKINPALVMVEEIYAFFKRVEAVQARPPMQPAAVAGPSSATVGRMGPPPNPPMAR